MAIDYLESYRRGTDMQYGHQKNLMDLYERKRQFDTAQANSLDKDLRRSQIETEKMNQRAAKAQADLLEKQLSRESKEDLTGRRLDIMEAGQERDATEFDQNLDYMKNRDTKSYENKTNLQKLINEGKKTGSGSDDEDRFYLAGVERKSKSNLVQLAAAFKEMDAIRHYANYSPGSAQRKMYEDLEADIEILKKNDEKIANDVIGYHKLKREKLNKSQSTQKPAIVDPAGERIQAEDPLAATGGGLASGQLQQQSIGGRLPQQFTTAMPAQAEPATVAPPIQSDPRAIPFDQQQKDQNGQPVLTKAGLRELMLRLHPNDENMQLQEYRAIREDYNKRGIILR